MLLEDGGPQVTHNINNTQGFAVALGTITLILRLDNPTNEGAISDMLLAASDATCLTR